MEREKANESKVEREKLERSLEMLKSDQNTKLSVGAFLRHHITNKKLESLDESAKILEDKHEAEKNKALNEQVAKQESNDPDAHAELEVKNKQSSLAIALRKMVMEKIHDSKVDQSIKQERTKMELDMLKDNNQNESTR